jgi:urea transport system ATP-binding protein
MLLVQDPRLLILDEPVAGMTREERTQTGRVLQQIARDHTVIVVEHDMDFLRRFATKVTVMHEGKVLTEGPVAAITKDPRVQEVYLGQRQELPEDAPLETATG